MAVTRFAFAFAPAYRIAALPFGVTPSTALVEVSDHELHARFGPWRVRTPVTNIAGVEASGPYRILMTIGPAHLSFTDRGLTMATNGDRGVCIRFREPVAGIEPTGRIRHPGLTVTVADCDGLLARLAAAGTAPT
jgi:hypothetical protein